MSYEGYTQFLCPVGHRWTEPENYGEGPVPRCPHCNVAPAWQNSVDDTNVDAYGIIPEPIWKTLEISPEVAQTCNLGHSHITVPARYRRPTDEELPKLKHRWDSELRSYVPLKPV